jgi:hypothetical protein
VSTYLDPRTAVAGVVTHAVLADLATLLATTLDLIGDPRALGATLSARSGALLPR